MRDAEGWADQLSEEQKQKLQWLKDHRCTVEAKWASEDPLQGLPEGLVLEVLVDKHAVVKMRGADAKEMFGSLFEAARDLFDWVERHDLGWKSG